MSNYSKRKNSISSDDPEAILKLEAKLTALTAEQEQMKNANAYYRKHKTMKGYPGISDDKASEIDQRIAGGYSWEQQPYPSYKLTNNSANIRRVKKRIEGLKSKENIQLDGWEFDGGRVEMNTEYNRIQIFFDGKPDEDVRTELKGRGFRWAPRVKAWQRQLNGNGLYAVKQLKCVRPDSTLQKEAE